MSQTGTPLQRRMKKVYRTGAISMIVAGVLVLITLPLIPVLIPSLAPSSVQSGLQALQSQDFLYVVTWGLFFVSDLLYLVAFPALYYALKLVSRAALSITLILNTLFVALDVGLQIPFRISLVGLSNSYAAAQTSAQQASLLAKAQFTIDASNITALVATLFQFLAVILASYAMLRSRAFKRSSGYIGILAGILALLFIPAFALGSPLSGIFNIAGFAFLVVWSLLVGNGLRKFE